MDTETAETPASPEIAPNALTDEALQRIFGEAADNPHPDDDALEAANDTAADPVLETPAEAAKPAEEAKPADAVPDGIDLTLLTDDATPPEADKPATPAVEPDSEFVSTIKQWLPNAQAVTTVVDGYQRHTALAQALSKGDVAAVTEALGNPLTEALLEAVYRGFSEKIVDRYIAEKNGTAPKDPQVDQLQRELAEVRQYLNTGIQSANAAREQQKQMTQFKAVTDAITSDLDKARFPNDDAHSSQRDLIRKATLADLGMNGQMQTAMNGDLRVVRKALKANLEQWVKADKPKAEARTAARAKQETAPKPVTTSTATAAATQTEPDVFQRAANFVANVQRRGNK